MQTEGLESKESHDWLGDHRGLTDGMALEKTGGHADNWVKIPPTHHTVTLGLQIGKRLYKSYYLDRYVPVTNSRHVTFCTSFCPKLSAILRTN